MLKEKEDLRRTLRMFESLSRDHRIAVAASIDAYRREEMLQEADWMKEPQEGQEVRGLLKQNEVITACVDETIEKVCKKIQEEETAIEQYPDTVKALALLVLARASLNQRIKKCN